MKIRLGSMVLRELTGIATEVPDAAVLRHDAFYQSPNSGYNVGPYRASEEVLAARPGRFHKIHSGLGLPGMTFLYPAPSPNQPAAEEAP